MATLLLGSEPFSHVCTPFPTRSCADFEVYYLTMCAGLSTSTTLYLFLYYTSGGYWSGSYTLADSSIR